jgi:hypothetical protein
MGNRCTVAWEAGQHPSLARLRFKVKELLKEQCCVFTITGSYNIAGVLERRTE